ncbi:methylenetetrahydrofolate reductase (NADPH) [Arthrobacter sp. V4I6]|uniref:methylenetetrahydrofolate reductase n=1 Tax=unclassified Arthrobacter TaxID=235627 RepID=UPI002784A0D6|nr:MULTISPECIES: methylenetetrahydrofolate reductase [unclassified Arthrobacter]MDQ0819524.1 methylenetetrahydrofolate reductase (NADPH) [Arthrobacter sp. V1I7]MDQ0853706.1 methylenetetrahydrofolate reductase (NADPH) [Arthrobacter sp. V4I6]
MMFPIRIEIIPSEGIVERVTAQVPLTTPLTVTCLPQHGIERTMRAAVQLSMLGYTVVPHLAARSLHSRADLTGILRDCDVAGIGEVFVIGGDRKQPAGPYEHALPLLDDIAQYSGGAMRAGVAGYPEGHPSVNPVEILDALLAKQHVATHVVTQMCFSASKILDYTALLRREGVRLPVWAGVAGAVPRTKLVSLATQIGVGSSLKFLSRKGPLARKLLSGDRYSPQSLVSGLESQPATIAGIHLYSFNSLDSVPGEPDQAPTSAALQPASIRGAARDN